MNAPRVSVILDGDDDNVELPTAEEAVSYRDGVLVRSEEGTLRFMSQKNWSAFVKDNAAIRSELPAEAVAVNNKGWIYAFTDRG